MQNNITKEIRDLNKLICQEVTIKDHKVILNNTQMQIIFYLINHIGEEVCQKDLESETNLKKASITGTLDSMEEKGVITRKQSSQDKRKNIIILSEKVIKEKELLEERISDLEKRLQQNITKEEMEAFAKVIKKMTSNIKGK